MAPVLCGGVPARKGAVRGLYGSVREKRGREASFAELSEAALDGGSKVFATGASLCCLSVIELQQPPYPFSALDRSVSVSFRIDVRKHEVVTDSLMISFEMIMGNILIEHMAKCSLTEQNHSVETF